MIPGRNEGDNLLDTVECVLENSGHPDLELVVVDDGSTDGSGDRVEDRFGSTGRVRVVRGASLGISGARNLGARNATGDHLVFLDAHCYTPPGWLSELLAPLRDPRVGLVGPAFANLSRDDGARGVGVTWRDASLQMEWLAQEGPEPYPVPLLPGGCQAIRRADFERFGAFESLMTPWGSEGEEQSLRVWLLGYRVIAVPRAVIHHLFRERAPYQVDPEGVIFNRLLTALLHFNHPRLRRVFDGFKAMPEFIPALIALMESDVMARRRRWRAQRRHDDDWFCERFGCQI